MPSVGFTVSFDQKNNFFDREHVQEAIRRAGQDPERNKRAGLLVRRIARNSMRRVKKKTTISAPGTPPRSRSPEPNLRTILAVWDDQAKRVVVGPVKLPRTHEIEPIPKAHEHGGKVAVTESKVARLSGKPDKKRFAKVTGPLAGKIRKAERVRRKQQKGAARSAKQRRFFEAGTGKRIVRVANYPPRPFMRPALQKALTQLAKIWQNSIRGSRRRKAA